MPRRDCSNGALVSALQRRNFVAIFCVNLIDVYGGDQISTNIKKNWTHIIYGGSQKQNVRRAGWAGWGGVLGCVGLAFQARGWAGGLGAGLALRPSPPLPTRTSPEQVLRTQASGS